MVSKGQFLERPTLVPLGDTVLEGLFHRGTRAPPLLVLSPGDEGGGMDYVVAAEVVWAAAQAGHPTLRFNYRGVGGSPGAPGDVDARADDAEAAIRVLLETAGVPDLALVVLGGSATVALHLAARTRAVAAVCFISPRGIAPERLSDVTPPPLVIIGQADVRLPRGPWMEKLAERGGQLELIPGADATFQRNLSLVGRCVADWLASLAPDA